MIGWFGWIESCLVNWMIDWLIEDFFLISQWTNLVDNDEMLYRGWKFEWLIEIKQDK